MKLTNEKILQIALQQSAIDANCSREDFLRTENVIAVSKENAAAVSIDAAVIRIIFLPEKRDFSDCDIRNYMLTYMFWWLMVVVIGSLKSNFNLSNNASILAVTRNPLSGS